MKRRLIIFVLFNTMMMHARIPAVNSCEKSDKSIELVQHIKNLSRETEWKLLGKIKLQFDTYHPQGMVKIGDYFYMSSVKTIRRPERYAHPKDGHTRGTGMGTGYLFKFDQQGNLLDQVILGDSTVYHPGGIDFDGEVIWVPVAEYRPDSRSMIYKVDPNTMQATRVFDFDDHIGAIVRNRQNNILVGVSWGSRRFYTWILDGWEKKQDSLKMPDYEMQRNGTFYIDYQDCQYAGGNYMLCSGLKGYNSPDAGHIAIGGLELVDLDLMVAVFQLPVQKWLESGEVMSRNPFFCELFGHRIRLYFVPQDNESTLFIFDEVK